MPANLENSAVATGLEKSVFIPIPKKGNAKECSNYCKLALISHARKVIMLRILQARLQQYVNCELPGVQLDLEKAEEPEIKLPTSIGLLIKQESSRKTSTSALLWRSKWQPTPVFLPGESHGWRSLVGNSPHGCKATDMTEQLHFHFLLY